jgi:hypothetical protein
VKFSREADRERHARVVGKGSAAVLQLMSDGQRGAVSEADVQEGDLRCIVLQLAQSIGVRQEWASYAEPSVLEKRLEGHTNERLVSNNHAAGGSHHARSPVGQELEEPRLWREPTGFSLGAMKSKTVETA